MYKTLSDKFYPNSSPLKQYSSSSHQNLPMISLNQLESKFANFKKKFKEKQNTTDQNSNPKDINVSSPFYDRMKTHKQNCKCPYHRKQRLTLVPVRHTDKSNAFRVHDSKRKISFEKEGNSLGKDRNKSLFYKHFSSHKNKSITDDIGPFSQTQPLDYQNGNFPTDYTYEKFMKDYHLFMLKKKGFVMGQSNHVVRKGIRDIFDFIHKNLDFSVQKMASWISSVQKDRDYGQFYVERFKEMKINHEFHSRKPKNQTTTSSGFSHLLNKAHKPKSQKLKFNHSSSNFSMQQSKKNKKTTRRSVGQEPSDQESASSSSQHSSSSNESNDSGVSLDRILSELKLNNKLSDKTTEKIMKKGLESFKELFSHLNKNIIAEKYTDDLLEKIDNQIFQPLLKKFSSSKTVKNIAVKIDIITKTQEVLRKQRHAKSAGALSKDSQNDIYLSLKSFITSKRNTITEHCRTSSSLHNHSKKCSENCSLNGSETSRSKKFHAIQEDEDQLDDDATHTIKTNKHLNHGNVRRSKLIKSDELEQDEVKPISSGTFDYTDRNFEKERQKSHKGFFTRAQRFLFDINMGKIIVNQNDSIFTMKRKIHVMNVLLKQSPQSPEYNELRDYVKVIQQRISSKTQNRQHDTGKSSVTEILTDEEIWKLISLENLGFNLMFYNLSSKFGYEDNEDLCILLNEIKMNGIKKFQNHITYKNKVKFDDEVQSKKRSLKTAYNDDVFIQSDMGNMEFEPKIESQYEKDLRNTRRSTKRTKTKIQTFRQLTKMLKNVDIGDLYGQNWDFSAMDEMDEVDIEMNYQKIKKMFKYAKVHLPDTFDKYLKNTSLYAASQGNSFYQ